jgi:hypothetical protein
VDAQEKWLIRQHAIEVYDMRAIDELGMREVMARALAPVDAGVHLHVSFDVDFLDPEIAPGTGTTVRGGPTYREAQLCMEMIADTGRLGSLDIVELNPRWTCATRPPSWWWTWWKACSARARWSRMCGGGEWASSRTAGRRGRQGFAKDAKESKIDQMLGWPACRKRD